MGLDQTPQYAASYLGLHGLYLSDLFDTPLKQVKWTKFAKYDISAKNAGPEQTPHYCGVSSGFALFVLCPINRTLCFKGLDAHAVTANVANADISAPIRCHMYKEWL